jgi:pyocin large subunit-like protein
MRPDTRIPGTTYKALFLAIGVLCLAALIQAGGPGFRTEHLLQDHFDKYGREFGPITRDQYLRLAQQLRDTRPGKNILESRRPDGFVRFDRQRGYFGAYDMDGTIRNFFIPPEGIRFFERQAR